MSSLVKSNAFVGLEEFKKRMLDEAIRASETSVVLKKRKSEECLNRLSNETSKKQKTMNVSIGLNTNILRNLQSFAKAKQVKRTVSSERSFTDNNRIENLKFKLKMASDAAPPLVKSDAFVGLAQYQERLKKMLDEATSFSKKKGELKRKASADLGTYQRKKMLKTSNEAIGLVTAYNRRRNRSSLKTNYQMKNVTANNEKSQHSQPRDRHSTDTVICLPVVKSKSLIGMQQFRESLQTFYNDSVRASEKNNATKTNNCQKSTEALHDHKTPNDNSGLNLNENREDQMHHNIESSNGSGTLNDAKISNDTTGLEVNETEKITNYLHKKGRSETVQAKSDKLKRSMPRERLLRMDEAVQEWNSHIETCYTII